MALSGEVGELTEIFQWLTDDQARDLVHDPQAKANVAQELADVFAYLLRLADVLNVDLPTALENKITVNQERYPVDKAHGHARKYDSLDRQL